MQQDKKRKSRVKIKKGGGVGRGKRHLSRLKVIGGGPLFMGTE